MTQGDKESQKDSMGVYGCLRVLQEYSKVVSKEFKGVYF